MNDINFVFCKNVCEPYVLCWKSSQHESQIIFEGASGSVNTMLQFSWYKTNKYIFHIDLHIFISDFQELFVTNNSTFYERFMLNSLPYRSNRFIYVYRTCHFALIRGSE